MSQSQVSYSHLLVLIQLSPSVPSIHFKFLMVSLFTHLIFLAKCRPCSRAERASKGQQFPASGELGVVSARSAREILLVARLARLIAIPACNTGTHSQCNRPICAIFTHATAPTAACLHHHLATQVRI